MANKLSWLANCLIVCLMIYCNTARAQKNIPSDILISINVKEMPLNKVLSVIEKQTIYKFAYETKLIAESKKISLNIQNIPLSKLLPQLLKSSSIIYSIIDNQIVLQEIPSFSKITISGCVKDSISGELLPGASIYLFQAKTGANTNDYGFYSITINQADTLELLVSYVGFRKKYALVNARNNLVLNFSLTQEEILLKPIEVTKDNQDDNLKKYPLGVFDVSSDMIKTSTNLSGSGDIMNTIQMLPGIMAGLDGRSGYFVRGGNADQNLVQLDEATLYNPSHLLGFVSIFNTSAVRSTTLLKGGFPASYGDHLSSVLDVFMKDGSNQHFGGDIQTGTIASGLTLYGPIIKNKASFLVSARRSTIDLLFQPLHVDNYYSNYFFYDLNAKINFQLSQKNRIYLSLYQGRDNSSYNHDTIDNNAITYGINFGNQALTLRWNHLFSQKLFSNTSLVYNNYYQSLSATKNKYYANLYSGISDIVLKSDLHYYPNPNHKISVGLNYLYQTLFPASVSDKISPSRSIITINPSEIPRKYSSRLAVYFSDDYRLSPKFNVYLGLRMPFFYKDDAQFLNIEPRVALLYLINPTTSLKLSYTQMHQYLHLVQSYNASFPAEIWIGSSKVVKPQNSQQASVGIFKNFHENMFQTSLEVYYKQMGNQLLFKGELQPTINTNLDSSLIVGQGKSEGMELFVKKNTGKLAGWLSYTLSYANQQFNLLNLGNPFPFSNDRRHCLYVSASYSISKHWAISSNFVLTSGRAFTLKKSVSILNPDSNPLYDQGNNNGTTGDGSFGNSTSGDGDQGDGSTNPSGDGSVPIPTSTGTTSQIVQNNYRLSPYNRLDISISYKKKRNLPQRVIETEWIFSVYNVYAHQNTFFAYQSIDPVTKQPIARQVSFIPVVPSISYNIKF